MKIKGILISAAVVLTGATMMAQDKILLRPDMTAGTSLLSLPDNHIPIMNNPVGFAANPK